MHTGATADESLELSGTEGTLEEVFGVGWRIYDEIIIFLILYQ